MRPRMRPLALRGAIVLLFLTACIYRVTTLPHPVFIDHIGATLCYPFIALSSKISSGLAGWRNYRKKNYQLQSTVAKLKDEISALREENTRLSGLNSFYKETKDAALFAKRYRYDDAVLAKIISRTFSAQEHSFLVNKGKASDIQQDMILLYHGAIIGRISEVYSFYAKGIFLTDSRCYIAAKGIDGAQGILSGENNTQNLKLSCVSHLENLEVGEKILSSGEGLVFPAGYNLGTVSRCSKHGVCQDVVVSLPACLEEIEYCHLIKPVKSKVT